MRRRRRNAEEPVSHDRWLVSYSDLVTTLFAFFVVLFAASYRDNKSIQGLSDGIHTGFQTLGAFARDPGNARSPLPGPAKAVVRSTAARPANEEEDNSSINVEALRKQLDEAIGPEIKKREVDTRVTPEGFVISLKELGFFRSGQATLMPGATEKIKRIAAVLARQGLELRVEGHSDDKPIHTAEFHSNWELSTARAMEVMTLIVDESGFDPGKISVAGYGQYRPLADNATEDGRGMNRRVDLVILHSLNAQSGASKATE